MPISSNSLFIVRPIKSADVHKVRELHAKLLPVRYPPSFFLQLLIMPGRSCLVAFPRTQPNAPIAFVSAAVHEPLANHAPSCEIGAHSDPPESIDRTKHSLELLTLGVLPAYQRSGLARLLLEHLIYQVKESSKLDGHTTCIYANVATSNTPALQFYERMGMYVSSDVIRGLYRTCVFGSRDAFLVVGLL